MFEDIWYVIILYTGKVVNLKDVMNFRFLMEKIIIYSDKLQVLEMGMVVH